MRERFIWILALICYFDTLAVSRLLAQQNQMQLLMQVQGDSSRDYVGKNIAGTGDINGDEWDDIVISGFGLDNSAIYFGGPDWDSIPDLRLPAGRSIEGKCDINEDGNNDICMLKYYGNRIFKVLVFFGGNILDSIPDIIFNQENNNDYFGYSIVCGDVNRDSIADIIISAIFYPNGQHKGKVYIYHGGIEMDTIPDWTVVGDSAHYSWLGKALASGGDLNGDGFDDLAVSGGENAPTSFVQVYFGGIDMDTIPDVIFDNRPAGFGKSLAIVNVNNDNYDDLVVGHTGWPSDSIAQTGGSVLIYYGGIEIDTIADVIITGIEHDARQLGWDVADAGDVNGDGFQDLVYGAPGTYAGRGMAFVNLGGNPMTPEYEVLLFEPDEWYNSFGRVVSGAGDFDGDGYDDVIVGAPYGPAYSDKGVAFVYAGNGDIQQMSTDNQGELPQNFELYQNYPNPFNANTAITFSLPQQTLVNITIYDLLGGQIAKLMDEIKSPGFHEIQWDAGDISSGIYFYRLSTGSFGEVGSKVFTKKMLLLK